MGPFYAQSEGDVFAYVKKQDMFYATQRSEVLMKMTLMLRLRLIYFFVRVSLHQT